MRARWLLAPLLVAALAGCPALLSDSFVIGDATTDVVEGGPQGSSSGAGPDATVQDSSSAEAAGSGEDAEPESGTITGAGDAGDARASDANAAPPGDASGGDAEAGAAAGTDAGVEAGAAEAGLAEAGCDASTIVNCGACGVVCVTTAESTNPQCVGDDAGLTCAYTCAQGYADCDTTPPNTNGCETHVATDPSNCGGCGNVCNTANSTGAICAGGTCQYTCDPGWYDCTTTPPDLDGCETQATTTTCTACGGTSCDTTHSIGGACSSGTCTYTGCDPGWADCNPSPPDTDGCSTSLSSTSNCGGCGNACDQTHSVGASCDGTTCSYTGCQSGFADCNQAAPNTGGCESSLSSPTTCGSCGNACPVPSNGAATCGDGGTCGIVCNAGYNACSGSCLSFGSTTSCGGCDNVCNTTTGTPSCNGTTCSYTCNSNRKDCNYATAPDTDGCECAGNNCCSGGTCQTQHSNGEGGSYYDCSALNTHSAAEAQLACEAYSSSCSQSSVSCGLLGLGGTTTAYCGTSGGVCYCWQYGADGAGTVTGGGSTCSASCTAGSTTWD